MSKIVKIVLASTGCALLIGTLMVMSVFSGRITMNPAGTVGNSAGNLNNGGLFCEYNGRVYFSNAGDQSQLYSMKPDETEITLLSRMKVRNVLAGGEYLYFYQSGSTSDTGPAQLPGLFSFCRSNLNGQNVTSLTTGSLITGQLVNNYLYLMINNSEGNFFYKLKIDQSEQVTLADYIINPACVQGDAIYYNGTTGDHHLYKLNTANDAVSELLDSNLWYPVADGGYIYYMDIENNYRICRYSLSSGETQVLTNDRVDCFNVGGGYVYYQKNDRTEPQLRCMRVDGSDNFAVAEGNYTRINMTSLYVYFQPFGDELTTYHSPLGSSTYSHFSPVAPAKK